jgi:hypothetical protein
MKFYTYKKIILLFVVISSSALAQQFKKELIGKYLPAKVMFGNGKVTDVLMRYQPPQFFRNPNNKFSISLSQSEADAYDHSGGIEAFMIDNVIWAVRPSPATDPANSPNFVVLESQGAIEEYSFMMSTLKKESDFNPLFNPKGTIKRKISTEGKLMMSMNDNQLREWMSDSPEIMAELKQTDSLVALGNTIRESKKEKKDSLKLAGKEEEKPKVGLLKRLEAMNNEPVTAASVYLDMKKIVNNYNAWYDKKYPGKIKYYFVDPPARQSSALEELVRAQTIQAKNAGQLAAKEDAKKKLDEQFASRSTTPAAEYASAKDNLPVKKETFAAKMDRIKNDGNKIGVFLNVSPVKGKPKPTGSAAGSLTMMNEATQSNEVFIDGEYADESLLNLGQGITDELNAALGRTDIELININNVPYRQSKFGRLDDWWASKYKLVFIYDVSPKISASKEGGSGKTMFEARLLLSPSLIVKEFIGPPNSDKQDVVAQSIMFGNFTGPALSQGEEIKDIKILYDKLLEKLGTPLPEKIKAERADAVKKFVEKKLN